MIAQQVDHEERGDRPESGIEDGVPGGEEAIELMQMAVRPGVERGPADNPGAQRAHHAVEAHAAGRPRARPGARAGTVVSTRVDIVAPSLSVRRRRAWHGPGANGRRGRSLLGG